MQPVSHPRLAPEVRHKFGKNLLGKNERVEDRYTGEITVSELRRLLRKRGLSRDDIEFNLEVLRIRDIATWRIKLEQLIETRYRCSMIMALSLAGKKIAAYAEETKQLVGTVSHALDKATLDELIRLLTEKAAKVFDYRIWAEAQTVGAVRSETYVYEEDVRRRELPDYDLIEGRFALDAIWDGEASKKRGATEQNRQLAKRRAPELDTNRKVVKARRSLGIPGGGFKDVEAAFQWSQEWSPDWSRRDDAYWQEVVWWESFTWVPYLERVMGRGYIMLDLPAMNQAVQDLVDGYDYLGRAWFRALPFYLVRGRLEPPPRIVHQPWRERQKHEEIFQLWKKHQHDFKVVVSYNYGLTDADWEEIAEQEPAARLQYIRLSAQATIEEAALKIANRKGTLRDEKEWISEDYVRKLRSRKGVAKT